MRTNELLNEIRDANLSYLLLAQRMIRSDNAKGALQLGIDSQVAALLEKLSNAQIAILADTNMMLARFRFDDSAILGMLTGYNKERALARSIVQA